MFLFFICNSLSHVCKKLYFKAIICFEQIKISVSCLIINNLDIYIFIILAYIYSVYFTLHKKADIMWQILYPCKKTFFKCIRCKKTIRKLFSYSPQCFICKILHAFYKIFVSACAFKYRIAIIICNCMYTFRYQASSFFI